MNVRRAVRTVAVMVLLVATVIVGTGTVGHAPTAGADTDPTTLLGQGGSFLERSCPSC